jgi:hypothetical protein
MRAVLSTYTFLTSVLEGGEWSASRSGRFASVTHRIGNCIDRRGRLEEESQVSKYRIYLKNKSNTVMP